MTLRPLALRSQVQLFVKDLAPFVHSLDAGGVRYLRRTSPIAESSAAGARATTLAHVGVPVEGRVVELVGPYASVPRDARDDGRNGSYVPWRAHECPACHAIGRRD